MGEPLQKLPVPPSRRYLSRASLALAAAALVLNVTACWKVYRHEPLREAASRSLLASSSRFFYDSGPAEPLPVFLLKVPTALGADPDAALRAEGLAAYCLLVAVTFFALRRRFGETTAVMAALFLAANPYAGYYAVQGDSHLYALLFLVPFWYYFDPPRGGLRAALAAGLFAGLACLSRLDAAWAVLIMGALSLAVRRRPGALKNAAPALGLALLLVLPYLAVQRAKYGSPLYAQQLALRRWDNVDRYGYTPGAPYGSGPLGVTAFLLRKGPAGALQDAFSGLGRAFAYEVPRVIYYGLLFVPAFLGIYAAFALKRDALLFFLAGALLPVLPLAGIRQVPAAGGIELRYYLWTLWALCALAGLGFQSALEWVESRYGPGAGAAKDKGRSK